MTTTAAPTMEPAPPAALAAAAARAPQFGDPRRLLAMSLPIAVPVGMVASFAAARQVLGDERGYVAGFGVYWAACGGLAVGILGRERIRALFAASGPRNRRVGRVAVALLAWPVVGAFATRLIPELPEATVTMVTTTIGVAAANTVLEELLWRGVFITLWPRNPWLGWVWPALGFGAWHLAPQVIHPSPLGSVGYAAAAAALGLSWGWVAYRTGSLRPVALSHVATDASGLRNALFFLGSSGG